jgi:hypothetical protein
MLDLTKPSDFTPPHSSGRETRSALAERARNAKRWVSFAYAQINSAATDQWIPTSISDYLNPDPDEDETREHYRRVNGAWRWMEEIFVQEYDMLRKLIDLLKSDADLDEEELSHCDKILRVKDLAAYTAKKSAYGDLGILRNDNETQLQAARRWLRGLARPHWTLVDGMRGTSGRVAMRVAENITRIERALDNLGWLFTAFVSYAHANANAIATLMTCCAPLLKSHHVEIWWDHKPVDPTLATQWWRSGLVGGQKFYEELRKHIEDIDVGLIIVSDGFFKSEFIGSTELPAMLQRRAAAPVHIIPLQLEPCGLETYPDLQPLHRLPKAGYLGPLIDCKESLDEFLKRELITDLVATVEQLSTFGRTSAEASVMGP